MRASLLVAVALSFAACSGTKDYQLNLHGSAHLNRNDENQPNSVLVKVLRLKGQPSADAFQVAPFDDLWKDPIAAKGVVVDGPPQTIYVPASDKVVQLKLAQVPPEVTHIGILGLFNVTVTSSEDRLVLRRDELGAAQIWLHDHVLSGHAPATPSSPDGKQRGS